ncbi:MAG: esterase family protein [Rhodococcus sp.]|nr:esterase family protein [Rhodococcus sp. (in: high G+C Gram-positive bacteria)]
MRRRVIAAAGMALSLSLMGVATANAQPAPVDSANNATAQIERIDELTPTRSAVFIDSPSMQKVVQVQVLHPEHDGSRPSLYLLDGVGAGEESDYNESTWTLKTDIVEFFEGKNVNVVLPVGGTGSYYTNWERPDPVLGINQWETFLTRELPPIINSEFGGNGTNAVGGVSMGAMGAGNLITRHPEMYQGLAAFSGCLDNSSPSSQHSVSGTVAFKGGDVTNMWGPMSDPAWRAHNPSFNAEQLRGKHIYVSSGNGLPGPHERAAGGDLASTIAVGGPLEAAAYVCTQSFEQRLNELDIPATFSYHPWGTHSWPYWNDELRAAWPTLKDSLGL